LNQQRVNRFNFNLTKIEYLRWEIIPYYTGWIQN